MNAHKELVLTIAPTGAVAGLLMDDVLDTKFLGDQKIERASVIEFDQQDQSFYVLPTGKPETVPQGRGFKGYEIAREFEVAWLQACTLADKCDPYSDQGLKIADAIRRSHSRFGVHGRGAGEG